jgi:hypothetical protein
MKNKRAFQAPILPALAIVILISLVSCINMAKFTISHPQPVAKSQFTKVLVVPLVPIGNMADNELLSGERAVSDFVEHIFKSNTCHVIRAEQVRKEMKITTYDTTINLEKIAENYRPDGVFYINFQNLVSSGGFGNAANGYLKGDIDAHLLDEHGRPLLECSGYAHAENGSGFSPGFAFFLNTAFKDLGPKLQSVME